VKISSPVPLEMLLTFSSEKVMVVDVSMVVVVSVTVDVVRVEVVDVVVVAVIGQIDGRQDPPPTNNVS